MFANPFSVDEALEFVAAWRGHAGITDAEPTSRHLSVLSGLLRQSGTAGNLTTDAHLAALAVEHGAGVASFDRDLARFGVRVTVPAAPGHPTR